jgi:hypothetical protein
MESLSAMSTQTIELDTTQPWEPPEPPRGHGTMPRWVIPALVLLLAPIAPVHSVPVGSAYAPIFQGKEIGVAMFIAGDTMYEVPTDQHQPQEVRAFDLKTGKVRWERHFEAVDASWSALGGMLFQTVGRRTNPNSPMYPDRLQALDPVTGRTLWERASVGVELVTNDLTILVEWAERVDEPQGPEQPWRPQAVTMYAVKSRTGELVWTRGLEHYWTFAYRLVDWADPSGMRPLENARLAELSPSGELRITDLTTGRPGPPVQLPLGNPIEYFEVVDDRITVHHEGQLVTYEITTGREIQRHPLREFGSQCAPDFFCFSRYQDDGRSRLLVRQQSTGRTVLELPDAMITGRMGSRLLIQGDYRSGVRDTSLIDLAGDRVLRPLAPWGSARSVDDHRVIAVAHVVAQSRTTIAVLDVDTRYAVVVGEMRSWFVPPDCNLFGDYILCSSASDRAVWKLPAELRSRRQ